MKFLTAFCSCFFCLRLLLHLVGALSQDNPTGFVSLDCGYTGSAYADAQSTRLTWTPDSTFFDPTGSGVDTSVVLSVEPPPSDTSSQYFQSVRYFTGNRTKYCYVFDESNAGVVQGSAYLVRASFWAGQYVTAPPPGIKRSNASRVFFQIFINADLWDDVVIDGLSSEASIPAVKEVNFISTYSSEIAVCLGGPGLPGLDSPFISALELRLLAKTSEAGIVPTLTSMPAPRFLFTLHRINFGSTTTTSIRYPDDKFDRIWTADTEEPRLSTTEAVDISGVDNPPSKVMQTARTTAEGVNQLNAMLSIRGNSLIKGSGSRDYYFYLYMAEISDNVTEQGQRMFDINIYDSKTNKFSSATGYDILNYSYTNSRRFTAAPWWSGRTVFWRGDAYDQGSVMFNFVKSNGSVYGPLVNGLELMVVSDNHASAGTNARDVSALQAIKNALDQGGSTALRSWRGDPCLPYSYNWISCSRNETPTITSLSLANRNLSGEIPSSIANLTSLSTLDLQGNRLSGTIPEFLATLQNLKYLWLQNNNLSGDIPRILMEKQSSGELDINVNGNPLLSCNSICTTSESPKHSSKSNMKFIIIGIVGGILIILVIICVLTLSYYHHRKKGKVEICDNTNKCQTKIEELPLVDNKQLNIATSNKPRAFSYVEVVTITNNFSVVLGKGGFGTVFHGLLENTSHVAVKTLSKSSTQGIEEFLNEVTLLSRVHHRNLVGLFGYCIENQVMLIYEYMPNGSLERIIHGPIDKGDSSHEFRIYSISWRDRLKILLDAAQGIDYLHNGCRPKIIHRDLKPANILINENMEAKISDFGISRSNSEGFSNFVTTLKGSTSYMAPEYIEHGQIDEKIDVYAFGIVLLEVISGRLPICTLANGEMQHIKHWVKPLVEAGKLTEIIDPNIEVENLNVSSMWKVIEIAMACTDELSTSRPTMEEVVHELKSTFHMELEELSDTNSRPQSIASKIDNLLR